MNNEKDSRKILATFSIAAFLNDIGFHMISPVWPFFVTSFLGANMAILGLIDGLGDALVSISQAVSGYVSDRIRKRKIFIWTGYVFGSISRIGYALSSSWRHLIPFKILDRTGKIRGAPRDAIIADVSTKKNRGRNFGLLRAMDNLGAVCGVIITIFLFSLLGYQKLFLLAAVPSLIAVIFILILIKERKTRGVYKGLSLKEITPNLKIFILLSSIFALGSFSYSFLLVYGGQFTEEFNFQATLVPIFFLISTVTTSLMSLPFGKLADKLNRKTVLILSYLLFGLTCLGSILVRSFLGLVSLFVLYGLHKAAIDPVQRTFVSELSPVKYRASTLGAFQMIVGLCALPASIVAGLLIDNCGFHASFYFSLGLTAISILLMFFVKENSENF
jgi:MFS family permease